MRIVVLFLIFAFGLCTSCGGTKTILDPRTNTVVKVYETEEFSFYYPKRWRQLNLDKAYYDSILVSVAPKKQIYPLYISETTVNGKVYRARGNKKNKDQFEDKNSTIIDADAGEYSSAIINLKRLNLNQQSFDDYLNTEIAKIKPNSNNFKHSKVSDQLSILSFRRQGYRRDSKYKFAANLYKVYYYKHNKKVYKFSYSANEFKYSKYLDEATNSLSSFKLK
ncbi:hypothetical protein SAMN05444278_102199 [Psychroflexus salarius]|uniref:PsbP C-terminal domain-containing protein n=1 Tax=Psychroflexus salarius TaxID=1155689 RepID=A0A1M4U642_9FLAO|nr:hypothetical protein [Psychroflexus salarius]SHE52116.1 hypothetical protein SAMN05444278_102199 [Psychroflexus salarius]